MKILNFGSLNCDYVYSVHHMVEAGETLASSKMETFPGGKGLNQSIALARAGAPVSHAGLLGEDGDFLLDIASSSGVDCSLIERVDGRTGHAIIQLDRTGQNCILLYGGSNRRITEEYIERVLTHFGPGDLLLMQNEINLPERIVELAHEKGLVIALNPSPCDDAILSIDLNKVSFLILNEVEGAMLSGEPDLEKAPDVLLQKYPHMKIVLTLGKEGAVYMDKDTRCHHPIFPVETVDTTGAGDTFTGYFLTSMLENMPAEEGLKLASAASAIAVSRMGAASSIPTRKEVEDFLKERT
ncbi:MAG: ribokinase [Oscillospiraceae bacterium]|nr:ribokinase [Oscillospiraceae bacterium]